MRRFFSRIFSLDSAYSVADKAWAILFLLFPTTGAALMAWFSSGLGWFWSMTGWAGVVGVGIVAFFLLAIGLAAGVWAAERWGTRRAKTGLLAEEKSATISARPELHLEMTAGNVFILDGSTGIALVAQIWNTGAPSVATSWDLLVYPGSGLPERALFTVMPDTLRVSGSGGLVLRATESLAEKTKTSTIGATPTEGRLLFYTGLRHSVVMAPDTKLELTVKDIYGVETKKTQSIRDWLPPSLQVPKPTRMKRR